MLKKIILFCTLISCIACSNKIVKENVEVLNLNIKDKKLHRFFSNSAYHRLKGLSYKDSSGSYKLKINNNLLSIKIKDRFLYGFQEGFLFNDSITFYLHDLDFIASKPLIINFNNYRTADVNFLPLFTRENLELLKNRSSKIYRMEEDGSLIDHYVADEYLSKTDYNLKDLVFHNSSIYNLKKLKKLNLYPKGYDAFFIIHNPLTGLYTLLPDFKRFGADINNISSEILNQIKIEESIFTTSVDTTIIDGNVSYDKSEKFVNEFVFFKNGANVLLNKNANLEFINCTVTFDGQSQLPIFVSGQDNNSIKFNESSVIIRHTYFENLSNFDDGKISLPSAITFYNSEVFINDSKMKNNIVGDDFINFYNSKFNLKNIIMEDVFADAIDSDFSFGVIENLQLNNIGNDGLDFSGSNVFIDNSVFNNIQDKALSIGESSEIKFNNSKVFNSELAIVVKDGSSLFAINNLLENNKVDYSVFFKKDFYPAPLLDTDFININNTNLFQKGVILKQNNLKNEFEFIDDVESLLYGKTYGKASE